MKTDRTVFVGSTFRDLEVHRRALIEALRDLVWLKVMESRGAASGNVVENCLRWVRTSDVYVGVLGMCYGSREPRSGKSFTELEYDEATRLNLPCLIYLIDEERHPLPPSSVDRGKDGEDLVQFKAKVSSANHCGLFRSPEHLQYQVARDIIALLDDLGWWTPLQEGAAADDEPRQGEWRIRLCAWGSPDGVLDFGGALGRTRDDEPDMAAAILVSRFARGDFSNLTGVVSLRPEIRNALRASMAVRDIDESALADVIRVSGDAMTLRLLVDIAGLARAKGCVEAICRQALQNGRRWDRELHRSGYMMRSFLEVTAEALGRMPPSCGPVLARYAERARESKQWHVRDAFERAMKDVGTRSLETM